MTTIKDAVCLAFLLAGTATPAFAVSESAAADAFRSADANSDAKLSRREFTRFIRKMAKLGNPNAKRAVRFGAIGFRIGFRNADANGDGFVTSRELQRIR
ncbi:hypothetical protein N9H93_04290 [Rhizobiaceae bacterium]|nr:hypothetical protein [Rhizobiaceae bacterium]